LVHGLPDHISYSRSVIITEVIQVSIFERCVDAYRRFRATARMSMVRSRYVENVAGTVQSALQLQSWKRVSSAKQEPEKQCILAAGLLSALQLQPWHSTWSSSKIGRAMRFF
jgi:hypothetical protein